MMRFFRKFEYISPSKQSIAIIVFIVVLAITFETFQQIFYIERFNLGEASFTVILKRQVLSWGIWVIASFFLVQYAKRNAQKEKYTFNALIQYMIFILFLVCLCILIIANIRLFFNGEIFSFSLLFKEYVTFYMFQKMPIFTLGYFTIAIILHLYFINEKLQVKVHQLIELKNTNETLYQQLRPKLSDKTDILNIKIGNKRKIIPVADINWIEADDYCVKVHLVNGDNYTMRSTLKALEEKLKGNFLRVHRKAIVNMNMTKEFNLSNSPSLTLNNETEIPVSKSNLKSVKDFLS
ncbi:hypothetical protein GTQ40_01180 [Flavobacteriaceae bacterium R38]|nr:hypothetical protein [Flavobacteriaceae bacterium R38]